MPHPRSQAARARLVLYGTLLFFSGGWAEADAQESASPIIGIDVSHHSGDINWTKVMGEGIGFVYLKASEGVDAADPRFQEHWKLLGELAVPRGAYHFYVTEDDPLEQARFFLSRFELKGGDLPPVVDVETLGHGTRGPLSPRLRQFLELVEEETGVRPMIYTSPNFWDANFEPDFGDYPLWVAEYGVESPRLPAGWERWHLWQYEGNATIPGIEKGADRSRLPEGDDLPSLDPRARPDDSEGAEPVDQEPSHGE